MKKLTKKNIVIFIMIGIVLVVTGFIGGFYTKV